MASIPRDRRAGLLHGHFMDVLSGKRRADANPKLFLEAIQNERTPSVCVEMIISKPSGLGAFRDCVRADLSSSFILSNTLKLIGYLSDPGIKTLADGQFLRQLLDALYQPPVLWNRLVNLALARGETGIPEDGLKPFAWLTFELLSLHPKPEEALIQDVTAVLDSGILKQAHCHETREFGYRIDRVLQLKTSASQQAGSLTSTPGGRHDNDKVEFRDIAIYPTTDEVLFKGKPFYRTAKEVADTEEAARAGVHLDNQFRLLREDMLAELREDLHVATGRKKGRKQPFILGELALDRLRVGEEGLGGKLCLLGVSCGRGFWVLRQKTPEARRKYLENNPNFFRHQAFGVFYRGDDIYGFTSVHRNVDLLCQTPPVILLQFTDGRAFGRVLHALKNPQNIEFAVVDTPVFAYEPVLDGLKHITELPLQDILVNPKVHSVSFEPQAAIRDYAAGLRALPKNAEGSVELPPPGGLESAGPSAASPGTAGDDVRHKGSGPILLDDSQLLSLTKALEEPLSLIQGPPGTGKSFLGAHIAKCIYALSTLRILVISYTNHALDQFLGDLLAVRVPEDAMMRLGSKSKCADTIKPLLLSEHYGQFRRRPRESWSALKREAMELAERLREEFDGYKRFSASWCLIEEHLEFSEEDKHFYEAFRVPARDGGGWNFAGGGKRQRIDPGYLYQRWSWGHNPGAFKKQVSQASRAIWNMPKDARKQQIAKWTEAMLEQRVETIQELARQYNAVQDRLETLYDEGKVELLQKKRIIGCTTTVAAKDSSLIRQAKPDIVLVEEAGEILESHVLTSLAPTVKQLILIGDHKQLRPKASNYALTVEKGDGYDLNRSLFERMILQEAPYTTLHKQHRMVPEISMFARELTYPELVDGPKTLDRPLVSGLQDRVVFVSHTVPEVEDGDITDRRDPNVKASKRNIFEAEMVLKCVKYLAQQGYKTGDMVVLTPYLGQLRELKRMLKEEYHHDSVLSDLDASELVRAGLLSSAASNVNKQALRISTIDNYQGEESDIVLVSLTRSNAEGDIGFMKAPQRLNVLLTRARNCLVMVGNAETFMKSKRGADTWLPFFELLKAQGHLYDGFPVRCSRHPEKAFLLGQPSDFDKYCPDGGCAEPCDAPLSCGLHKCPRRCHQIADHSKVECSEIVQQTCARQHKSKVQCRNSSAACAECQMEDADRERRIERDLKLEADRLARQKAYAQELQTVQDELEHHRRVIKYQTEEDDNAKALAQQQQDLAALKETAARVQQQKEKKRTSAAMSVVAKPTQDSGGGDPWLPGSAQEEWEFLKKEEMATSRALDELMGMIGLEDVKLEFLSIKSKVDTALRQDLSLSKERFSCALLGNPGTGKTTVARLYAQFLTTAGVIAGACFKETTGASLANMGVSGCKNLLEEIKNEGGGVLFIDEAYQLTSGNNHGGGAVLDFLLAEVENLTGKVVFVLAGYSKPMESFFAHNPGLPSRFPNEMKFADYTDDELLRILEHKINKRYDGRMDCEGGLRGLYCRIVARRIGRGRGKEGFGNARAVENTLAVISRRQADRHRRERRARQKPDNYMLFTKEDLIGPEPAEALATCEAWRELQGLIGLAAVKEAVKALADTVGQNYQRELEEQPPIEYSLNRVFLGSPGTGKTTVAKLYGRILADLGLLSKGEVIVKNPSDFVGGALGQSEQQTKGILAASVGKVLVIDEAYGLYGGGGSTNPSQVSDPYKTAVIDTIVAEVQSVPGDDRCVLLLGYKDEMEKMFQNVNPGLQRRFPTSTAFQFDDFSEAELARVLDLKLKKAGFGATEQARRVAAEMLSRARNRPNFGNAGEVDIILDAAKACYLRRTQGLAKSATVLEASDFDANFDRAEKSQANVRKLFEGTVGCEDTVALLEGYQATVRSMKALGVDPRETIPFNFLFRGPPGTGKTTTAKKMGAVFYDMGFLATDEVVECSASDLVGQYVGQTGPKVQQALDKALGRVLFVDEAYRLAGGAFGKEAMDELVDSTTKPRYRKKLVIILAGYEGDMNRLMAANPGLTSRFPEVINFRPLAPRECAALLAKILAANKARIPPKAGSSLDLSVLEKTETADGPGPWPFMESVVRRFADLTGQAGWASARDVETLAQEIVAKTIKAWYDGSSGGALRVEAATVDSVLQEMHKERALRAASAAGDRGVSGADLLLQQLAPPTTAAAPVAATTQQHQATTTIESEPPPPEELIEKQETSTPQQTTTTTTLAKRDAGVSDAVWAQLQLDLEEERAREASYQRLLKAQHSADDDEAEREKIVLRLLAEQKRREEEAAVRQKLAAGGLCPAGYQWIKQGGGYRCAGGSHYISDDEVRLL